MPKNIIISGLTAAGKTTHANIFATERNMDYVSASTLLLQRVNIQPENADFWVTPTASDDLEAKRQRDLSIDKDVDKKMQKYDEISNNIIFDSWGLAWISSAASLRIWLQSSLESRCWKAFISHGADPHEDMKLLKNKLTKKDDFTRELFRSNYNFDIYTDYEVFDYVIDITSFIKEPTIKASKRSILEVQKILSSIVEYYYHPIENNSILLENLIRKFGKSVFQKSKPL